MFFKPNLKACSRSELVVAFSIPQCFVFWFCHILQLPEKKCRRKENRENKGAVILSSCFLLTPSLQRGTVTLPVPVKTLKAQFETVASEVTCCFL